MAKVRTLQPRIAMLQVERAQPISVKRITGRRRQDRNRRLFESDPLCVECRVAGRVSVATQWDHKTPLHLGGADDESNLQGLCDDCHDAKTAREAHDRGAQGYPQGGATRTT